MADFRDQNVVEGFVKDVLTSSEGANGNEYALSFAVKGQSGASYGIYQNDIANNENAKDIFTSSSRCPFQPRADGGRGIMVS